MLFSSCFQEWLLWSPPFAIVRKRCPSLETLSCWYWLFSRTWENETLISFFNCLLSLWWLLFWFYVRLLLLLFRLRIFEKPQCTYNLQQGLPTLTTTWKDCTKLLKVSYDLALLYLMSFWAMIRYLISQDLYSYCINITVKSTASFMRVCMLLSFPILDTSCVYQTETFFFVVVLNLLMVCFLFTSRQPLLHFSLETGLRMTMINIVASSSG
jgi:hypothetical protein